MANFSDLNPAFVERLNRFKAALDQAGIGYTMESGYRSPEQQAEIYERSGHGTKFAAAPPWRSYHNYGLAADVLARNAADYPRMWDIAPQYGLTALKAYDKPHFQMGGGNLNQLVNQYRLAGWRPADMPAPAQGAIAYDAPMAQPSRPGTRTPGTTLNSPLDIVLQAESGDRNINNTHQMTSSGQAQGNAQITTGTWNDFAPQAGIDLKQYPTPDSAPRDVQIKVASIIPLNRWASSTVNKVLAAYPGIDTSKTLGSIQSAAINPSGGPGAAAGGPSAVPASTAPGQAPFGSAGNLPGFEANSPGAKMTAEGLKSLGIGGKAAEPPPMPPPMQLQTQATGGPMMLGPGQQNMMGRAVAQQALAQQGFLTQPQLASAFTGAPPQQPIALPGTMTGMPSMPGTTLNSPSQLQMALMQGALSPYDAYGQGQGQA